MTSQARLVLVFILGFGSGLLTFHLHIVTQEYSIANITFQQVQEHEDNIDINIDPFPLPPCTSNLTSAVYSFYGYPIRSHNGNSLLSSINSLVNSKFPGRVRVIIDEKANSTLHLIPEKFIHLLSAIDFLVVPLPDLNGKELIPHSNKIRALQAGAFIYDNDLQECTISFDTDVYVHPHAPWNTLLSTLELNDFAVAKDCNVHIDNAPDFLKNWMPNTGVLAMRNTPRTRMVLNDWLRHFIPCDATHVKTCMPGTDQYPFMQLMIKHAVRFFKLDNAWNCRIPREVSEIASFMNEYPVYSLSILSNKADHKNKDASIFTTCGGLEECHILHGHYLKYFK